MKKFKIFILGVIIQFSIINIVPAVPPIEIGNIGGNEHDTAAIYTTQETADRIAQLGNRIDAIEDLANQHNIQTTFKRIFPVGSIYITFANQHPPLHGEYGITWEVLPENCAIMTGNSHNTGQRSGNNRLDTGATNGHVLTLGQMPAHTHQYQTKGVLDVKSGANAHGMWRHTANAQTSSAGNNEAHSHNLNIYNQKLLFWRRTA